METRHPLAPDPEPEPADDSERLSGIRRLFPSPTLIATLGFLSVPGFLYEPLEGLQVFALFFLAGLWPLVAGIGGLVYGAVRNATGTETEPGAEAEAAADEVEPTDWIDSGDRAVNARALVSMLVLQFQPILLVTGLLQLAGHIPIVARYRGDLPSAETYESDVDYRLPLEGTWTVVNGSPDREYSHSWGLLTQRYAYDFVITDEAGRTTAGERGPPEEYYCFGEPILAPADGVVVSTRDNHRDYHRTNGWMDPLQRSILGNHVVIDHENGEYSVLAHLQRGSVAVEPGERVERGQQVARCGNSGNTTEPHLHFHLQDRSSFFLGMGLPIRFSDVRTDHPRTAAETREETYVHAGQRVAHVGE
ncbi:M23 family metallopeptidase [Halopiger aswanensis]|uniref:Murein DD-endopeptidase MepM/ murein hydrolase activator NlpD n=1 Tax=Halopiger aswanensis TaxID=148449 RepID=A0A3R7FU74_9EURY|nr:M23 family metallopeptidase [Halopiger aswanensis]RKD93498.1 murein DD-endopeptidase MepM/ murein hydrolase activator NlpD [Halopiger aswanensis]